MSFLLHAILITTLVGLTTFFVSVEFATPGFRRSRIQQLVGEGDTRAVMDAVCEVFRCRNRTGLGQRRSFPFPGHSF